MVTARMARGFTLIELLVVMTIVAALLTLALPRYYTSIDRAKEAVLKENLYQLRDAIGKYYADKGRYPDTLEVLAAEKYVRRIPPDPITDSAATWVVVPASDTVPGVSDVRSGAAGRAQNGTEFAAW